MLIAEYVSKKALKEPIGQALKYNETSMFGPEYRPDGDNCVAGPSEYNLRWEAIVGMKDGLIRTVK